MIASIRYAAVALALLISGSAAAAHTELPDDIDPGLQSALEAEVRSLGLEAKAAEDRFAVALLDLSDPGHSRLAMINGHEMFYAASLPKIAILLGAAVSLDDGSLLMDDVLERDLHEMIRVSCNPCATRVLDRVGRERLLAILQSPDYLFYDTEQGGGLWVGKAYGPEPAYRRDPLDNQSHGATAFQATRFFYLLHRRELVSPEQSEMMLETLARPGIEHKFVKGLAVYEDLELFRKSGSWKQFHADSALVLTKDHAYVMVALIEDQRGSKWLESLAPKLHELIVGEKGPGN